MTQIPQNVMLQCFFLLPSSLSQPDVDVAVPGKGERNERVNYGHSIERRGTDIRACYTTLVTTHTYQEMAFSDSTTGT